MDVTTKVKKPVEAIQCANTFSLLQRKMYKKVESKLEAEIDRTV